MITQPRIIILIIVLVLSVLAINPQFDTEGVAVRSVDKGSPAALAGLESPDAHVSPTSREVIKSVDGRPVADVAGYYEAVKGLSPNQTFTVQTDQGTYRLTAPVGNGSLGLSVYEAPATNIRKGLDLSGGTRVILQPESEVAPEDLELIIENIEERLNVFGLSDVIVRSATDLAGDDFIVVEIAGANQGEVRELLSNQGVFEARIANETVFRGGDDITFVCRTPECSGIDSQRGGCQRSSEGGWSCPFYFQISLSDDAAERQADATSKLSVVTEQGSSVLSSPLELYLDGELVNSLSINAGLQGRASTDIQITVSGSGPSREAAIESANAEMRQLQTILVTGSLPTKLDIVKTDAISATLGREFLQNAFVMGFGAIFAVAATIFVFYRRLAISIPMILTMVSEGVAILGFAALVGWNIDLAAIAGIVIAIGTGVDDQIVIVDETLRQKASAYRSWKDRIKRAFFIIFAAYATTLVAMIPLLFAGAGLLRGFALTTIAGVTIGVLVTRPAFALMVERYLKED